MFYYPGDVRKLSLVTCYLLLCTKRLYLMPIKMLYVCHIRLTEQTACRPIEVKVPSDLWSKQRCRSACSSAHYDTSLCSQSNVAILAGQLTDEPVWIQG